MMLSKRDNERIIYTGGIGKFKQYYDPPDDFYLEICKLCQIIGYPASLEEIRDANEINIFKKTPKTIFRNEGELDSINYSPEHKMWCFIGSKEITKELEDIGPENNDPNQLMKLNYIKVRNRSRLYSVTLSRMIKNGFPDGTFKSLFMLYDLLFKRQMEHENTPYFFLDQSVSDIIRYVLRHRNKLDISLEERIKLQSLQKSNEINEFQNLGLELWDNARVIENGLVDKISFQYLIRFSANHPYLLVAPWSIPVSSTRDISGDLRDPLFHLLVSYCVLMITYKGRDLDKFRHDIDASAKRNNVAKLKFRNIDNVSLAEIGAWMLRFMFLNMKGDGSENQSAFKLLRKILNKVKDDKSVYCYTASCLLSAVAAVSYISGDRDLIQQWRSQCESKVDELTPILKNVIPQQLRTLNYHWKNRYRFL